MLYKQFKYTLTAFGYELEIKPAADGWQGFYQEGGLGERLLPLSVWGDLDLAKRSLCQEAQRLSGSEHNPADDCTDSLRKWKK
ncbi:MAG: hypothetical protein WKF37_20365, partial [Bryobacteraceae bacterium]